MIIKIRGMHSKNFELRTGILVKLNNLRSISFVAATTRNLPSLMFYPEETSIQLVLSRSQRRQE